MDPKLAHFNIRNRVGRAIVGPDRGPDMVGQAGGGWALVEEEDGITQEDGDGDGEQEREEPMACGGGTVTGKCLTNGVVL